MVSTVLLTFLFAHPKRGREAINTMDLLARRAGQSMLAVLQSVIEGKPWQPFLQSISHRYEKSMGMTSGHLCGPTCPEPGYGPWAKPAWFMRETASGE
jgi:hypothetical protein